MQKIKLLLPAYNEENSISSLLNRIKDVESYFPMNILVVNDGSTDDTLNIVKSHNVNVLDFKENKGLAEAIRTGIKVATEDLNETDILVVMDADDSQDPGLIPRMVSQIREGSDIVIASRYRNGSRIIGLTIFRKILSISAGVLFKIRAPIKGVRDYTCGYRAYKVSLLREMMDYYKDNFIEQQGFGCMAEILLKSRRFNPIIHELPFILRYDQKIGESKMNIFKTVSQTLKMIFS